MHFGAVYDNGKYGWTRDVKRIKDAFAGICVYCNHCQPCPRGLDVGLINKYYDLALAGDEMAKNHYSKLPIKADACVQCGHCESRCPFHVKQETRMKEIAHYFKE